MSTSSSRDPGPSAVLRTLVHEAIGPVDRFEERTVPLGEARVWAVWRDDEIVAWLKRHKQRDKARREVRAYTEWLPRMGWGSVRLLGTHPDAPNALLTAPAVGERVDRAVFTEEEGLAVFRELGRFLAALHGLEVGEDDDAIPLAEALPRRAEAWCERAEDVVDAELIDALRRAFDEPIDADLVRVPCHRDLQLHNLLVDTSIDPLRLTVIDFGQARLDVWLSDLVKLFQFASPDRAPLRRALLEGYGRRLTAPEVDLLTRLRALHGLATCVWASEHGDVRGVKIGWTILEDAVERWRS